MATFGELKLKASARIQDKLTTVVSSSEVGDQINNSIKFWKTKGFWFNQGVGSAVLTAGNPVLPSTGLFYIETMRINDQQMTYDLKQIPNSIYDGWNNQGRGLPYAYTLRGGQYELYWYPQQAYTVQVTGLKEYAPLVNDTDTNDFTIYADELILYDTLSRLTAEYRTDPETSDYYSKRILSEKNNLMALTNNMFGTGRAEVYETFNDSYY